MNSHLSSNDNNWNNWTCSTCHITIKSASKYKHMKTKKHLLNLKPGHSNEVNEVIEVIEDCAICMEPMNVARRCHSCKQEWCRKCDQNIPKCPYCRELIPGRNLQASVQAMENYNWYASSDAFVPTRQFLPPPPPPRTPSQTPPHFISQRIQSHDNELNLLIDFIRFIERNNYTDIFN